MYRVLLTGIALCAASTPAVADSGTTLSAEVTPVFGNGILEGCAINFDAVRQDVEYSKGDFVYVTGSLNFWAFPGKAPAFSLKLGIKPLNDPQADFQKPAEAYLLNGFTTNAAERFSAFDGETPGFKIFGFHAGGESLKSIETIGGAGQLKIGYAMKAGGMAAPLTIDLRIKQFDLDEPAKSETSPKAPLEWLNCMEAAINQSLKSHP